MTVSNDPSTTFVERADLPALCSAPAPWPARPPARRVIVFIVVLVHATLLLRAGQDLPAVLVQVGSLGLLAAVVARWVTDEVPVRTVRLMTRVRPVDGGLA